jgi:hypothetical protein
MLAEGITSVAEAGIGGGLVSHTPVELAAYGLAPGKLADLVVLSDDPRRVDPARIGAIEVLATALGGDV